MSDALNAHGTLIKVGDGGTPENFTAIAELKDIDGPNLDRAVHAADSHTSTWREVVPGFRDGQEVTFDVNLIPTDPTHDPLTGLVYLWNAGTKRNFQLVFPDVGNTTWQFGAFVTNVSPTAQVDGILIASITLRVSGEVSF